MYRQPDSPPQDRPRPDSALSHRRTSSRENGPTGRPLAQEPRLPSVRKNMFPSQVFSRPVSMSPAPSYRETRHRHQEKEEARALRDALQEMDIQGEARLHQAAQDEATELVWMHQNPGQQFEKPYAPYRNPDANRGSQSPVRDHSVREQSRKSSSSSKFRHSVGSTASSGSPPSTEFADTRDSTPRRRSSLAGSVKKNLKVNFALPGPETKTAPGDDLGSRNASSDSSKGVFRNPNDHIYEEPVNPVKAAADTKADFSRSESSALRNKARNVLPTKPLPWLRDRKSNGTVRDKVSRFDIHKNPPTQTRDPGYTRNESAPSPDSRQEEVPPTKDGKEIRSNDIRAATSKRLSDRSENLPMPSAVSDRNGRPIVSFEPAWKPNDQPKPLRQNTRNRESASSTPAPAPSVPTIEVAPSIEVSQPQPPPIPVINVPDIKEPTISEINEPIQEESKPSRTMSQPAGTHNRQVPPRRHTQDPPDRWYSPYSRSGVPTARCESCSHGISGKIVTAGGCRFHPECFACFHCQTPLECVAFYEEPESSRSERLTDAPSDADRVPRFYCHLDFHELFSPRCKSCKTPIEGEVVVACGAEWHVGHFFCAECGDVCLLSSLLQEISLTAGCPIAVQLTDSLR